MKPELAAKFTKVKKDREHTRVQGAVVLITAIILAVIILVNSYYLKIDFITYAQGFLIIGVIIGVIIGGNALIFPVSKEISAFLEIIEAYNIVEPIFKIEKLTDENRESLNDASKRILYAAQYLKSNDSFTSEATQWNLKNKQIEEKFVNTLEKKIAPLVKENKYPPEFIEIIALLFIDSDIDKIKKFNDNVENQTKDMEIKPIITLNDKIKNNQYYEIIRVAIITTIITLVFLEIGTYAKNLTLSGLVSQYYFESIGIWVAIFLGLEASPLLKLIIKK
jgi:uncharacterized integral membrane protein